MVAKWCVWYYWGDWGAYLSFTPKPSKKCGGCTLHDRRGKKTNFRLVITENPFKTSPGLSSRGLQQCACNLKYSELQREVVKIVILRENKEDE